MFSTSIVYRVEKLWRENRIQSEDVKRLLHAYCQFQDIEPELQILEKNDERPSRDQQVKPCRSNQR